MRFPTFPIATAAALSALAVVLATLLQEADPPPDIAWDFAYDDICTTETDPDAFDALVAAVSGDGRPGAALVAGRDILTEYDPKATEAALEVSPLSGEDVARASEEVQVTLRLTDRETGRPVSRQSVAGWMSLVRNPQVESELPCAARVGLFLQGRVTNRPDVDLNASRLLVLSRSGSVSVVDPQVDFTITQMETVMPLPGVPADWGLSEDGRSLFVTLPAAGSVAVIDTSRMVVAALIDLEKGSLPTTLLPLLDGGLAVHLSGRAQVLILHPDRSGERLTADVGEGAVVLSEDRAGTLFALTSDGRLSVIRVKDGNVIGTDKLVPGKPSLAYSAWNRTLYAVTDTAPALAAFRTRDLVRRADIALAPGVTTLAAIHGTRRLIALNRQASRLAVVDTAQGEVTHEVPTVEEPVEAAFTDSYAYIRGLAADHFQILSLNALRHAGIAPVDIQSSAGPMIPREALSDARLVAPYPGGALVANGDERQAYYYMEGMNAPRGTVPLYAPDVQGIIALERGFRETAPGVYQTQARLPKGGNYIAAAAIRPEGTPQCFPLSVAGTATARQRTRHNRIFPSGS